MAWDDLPLCVKTRPFTERAYCWITRWLWTRTRASFTPLSCCLFAVRLNTLDAVCGKLTSLQRPST